MMLGEISALYGKDRRGRSFGALVIMRKACRLAEKKVGCVDAPTLDSMVQEVNSIMSAHSCCHICYITRYQK